jgi:hypothetical protein
MQMIFLAFTTIGLAQNNSNFLGTYDYTITYAAGNCVITGTFTIDKNSARLEEDYWENKSWIDARNDKFIYIYLHPNETNMYYEYELGDANRTVIVTNNSIYTKLDYLWWVTANGARVPSHTLIWNLVFNGDHNGGTIHGNRTITVWAAGDGCGEGDFQGTFVKSGSQSPNSLDGEWNVTVNETFTVKGLGTQTGAYNSICTIASNDSSSGNYYFLDGEDFSEDLAGSYSILNKGKKIQLNIDSEGIEDLKFGLTDQFVEWIEAEGISYDPNSVTMEITSAKFKAIKTSSGSPTSTSLKIKGYISGIFEDKYYRKKFSYNATISFNGK